MGFIEQKEQKGTGHAVKSGRDRLAGLDGYLMVLYGDCPLLRASTLKRLIEIEAAGDSAAVLMTTMMNDPTGYGRVILDARGRVTGIVEQKAATPEQLAIREANMGIYCFRADLFWKHVDEIRPNNPAREYYLTDMAEILTRAGHRVEAMQIEDEREALGINTRVELADVDRLLRDRKVPRADAGGRDHREAGDGDHRFRRDGRDRYGDRAVRADPRTNDHRRELPHRTCAIVQNSEIGDGVEIGSFSIIGDSRLERGVIAGPFARLRPATMWKQGRTSATSWS